LVAANSALLNALTGINSALPSSVMPSGRVCGGAVLVLALTQVCNDTGVDVPVAAARVTCAAAAAAWYAAVALQLCAATAHSAAARVDFGERVALAAVVRDAALPVEATRRDMTVMQWAVRFTVATISSRARGGDVVGACAVRELLLRLYLVAPDAVRDALDCDALSPAAWSLADDVLLFLDSPVVALGCPPLALRPLPVPPSFRQVRCCTSVTQPWWYSPDVRVRGWCVQAVMQPPSVSLPFGPDGGCVATAPQCVRRHPSLCLRVFPELACVLQRVGEGVDTSNELDVTPKLFLDRLAAAGAVPLYEHAARLLRATAAVVVDSPSSIAGPLLQVCLLLCEHLAVRPLKCPHAAVLRVHAPSRGCPCCAARSHARRVCSIRARAEQRPAAHVAASDRHRRVVACLCAADVGVAVSCAAASRCCAAW
jgi:hypothetical protein